jgi:hypothetical protein
VGKGRLGHLIWLVKHEIVHQEAVNAIFLAAVGTLTMEEGSVRASIFQEGNPSPLPSNRALKGGVSKVGELQGIGLMRG